MNKKVETVMTYEQWKEAHKKKIRKMLCDTVSTCFQWIVITVLFTGLPFGMVIHWLVVGY